MSSRSSNSAEWHYCWVNPRNRVRRLGTPLECPQCRRFKAKHKCGSVRDSKGAWKDYPVDECVACLKRGEPLAEEPPQELPPQRKPRKRDPAAGKVHTRKPQQPQTRAEKRARKARRKQLILVAVSHGVETAKELAQVMHRFGAEVPRRTLYDDLDELTKDLWLIREKQDRENAPRFQRDWEWSYQINPRMLERLSDDQA